MRSFIAIGFSNEKIEEVLRELAGVQADIKLVEPQNTHITLKFLGEIDEARVEEIYRAMKKSFEPFSKFNVSIQGLGAFPSTNYMRVVWAGFKDNREKLIELQRALDSNLSLLNFKKEKRFEPHLTIGRVKSRRGKEELKAFVLKHRDTDFGSFSVDKIELKKSTLTPKGPIYSTVKACELK